MAVQRYLVRVTYTDPDGVPTYEPIVVRAENQAAALAEVEAATDRYRLAVNATRTLTVVLVTADV